MKRIDDAKVEAIISEALANRKLIPVMANGQFHLLLIRRGWRAHHSDGQIVYLEAPALKEQSHDGK
jgi:hypothetical protein